MDVELRHLRAFVAVVQHRSYTRAAAELSLTQPVLSRTVQQLEAILQVRLLERSTRHVRVTSVGQQFLGHAERILGELGQALAAVGVQRTLRLGFSWLLPDPWAQDTAAAFENATGATVTVMRRDDPVAALHRADVDVALVRGDPDLGGAADVHLFDEDRVAVVSTRSGLADRQLLDWEEIPAWPLVVNTVSGTTGDWSWPGGERSVEIVTCTNYDEWLENVAADRGIGVVPVMAARRSNHSGVRFIPLTGAPPVPVRLAYVPATAGALIRHFLDAATGTPVR
ncbi:LysR family transcriptional regulator [Prauserella halophila]|uniref:LysR family transcriptional regulator n=1 Tax=Prauserella halophila TaxID=185641 RepID=A0ABN1VZK7_9PSEU|nr:LysR family transcriptional regulator [Prauserella halophila]MCP2235237.1 DNA-binding transcriptional regulator, LysR family [Prauserella halophila]